jgi:hypothetical protein
MLITRRADSWAAKRAHLSAGAGRGMQRCRAEGAERFASLAQRCPPTTIVAAPPLTPIKSHPINGADHEQRWNKTAPHRHVADHNSTWRHRINVENRGTAIASLSKPCFCTGQFIDITEPFCQDPCVSRQKLD